MSAGLLRLRLVDCIEQVDLSTDLLAVAPSCKWRHAPVRERQDDDMVRVVACKGNGLVEQHLELHTILVKPAMPKLVIDANQQCHQVEWRLRLLALDAGHEVAGRPAGAGDDQGIGYVDILRAQPRRQLYRPTFGFVYTLADGV